MRKENAEHTLIFADMLGFAALTEDFPKHLIHSGPDEYGFQHTSSAESFNTFNRFHRILDQSVFQHSLNGSVCALLFSDCAFLEFGNSLLAAVAATELMRNFILEKIPVRMGIGKGTFYPFMFSTELRDSTIVSRSRFIGTAVVYAHAAEQCGGRGLRIFLHPSLRPDIATIQRRIRTMALAKPYRNACWELDFLYETKPAQEKPSAEEEDRSLFNAVLEMQAIAPKSVHRQYTQTITAMNGMRRENSRPAIRVRSRSNKEHAE